ncbi:MAG: 2-amino-4-hydroxy-6-hydroxymethyldihydropteridine diphosphokinase [bacterium]|nr:2-amino-4-hydroxy-6-hydroxymethyldihydropteridine diphosphokinase [bacterium]
MNIYLGLGSNLGDRAMNLRKALASLPPEILADSVSAVYETEPKYLESQPKFLNIACKARTQMSAREVLNRLKKIEVEQGRVETQRFGPRIIDIDLLFYGAERIDEPGLTVPHPGIAERAFVLVPLSDIAPDFVHPILGSTIKELKEKLGESRDVQKTQIKI